jgi:hypothetical protein
MSSSVLYELKNEIMKSYKKINCKQSILLQVRSKYYIHKKLNLDYLKADI